MHDERHHIQNLAETMIEIQGCGQNIASLTDETTSKTSSATDSFSRICSYANQLVHTETRKVEAELTLNHSGFVPMSPLVEVKTNNTLMPSISAVSALGI